MLLPFIRCKQQKLLRAEIALYKLLCFILFVATSETLAVALFFAMEQRGTLLRAPVSDERERGFYNICSLPDAHY